MNAWLVSLLGAMLALYAFMEDSIRVAAQGEQALRDLLPTRFNWPLFLGALLLMATPVMDLCRQLLRSRTTAPVEPRTA